MHWRLLLQVGTKFKFGQDHRIPGILVVSILSTGGPSRVTIQAVQQVEKDSAPLPFLPSSWRWSSSWWHRLIITTINILDTLHNDSRHLWLQTWLYKRCTSFLGIIIQMGHDVKGILKSYWWTSEQFFTLFYTKTVEREKFLTNWGRFLHFSDDMNQPDKNDSNYYRLWKMRTSLISSMMSMLNFTVHQNM